MPAVRKRGFSKGGFSNFCKSRDFDRFWGVNLLNEAHIEATGLRLGGFILIFCGEYVEGNQIITRSLGGQKSPDRRPAARLCHVSISWASGDQLVPVSVCHAKNGYESLESQPCGFDMGSIQ